MQNEPFHHFGNKSHSRTLLTEILPALESMIVNASKDFFTINETMQILSISRTQLYYLRTRGMLECKRVGRKVYITKDAINKLVMNNGEVEALKSSSIE